VVYATGAGAVTDPAVQARIDRMAADLAEVDHVVATEAGPVSEEGTTGILYVRLDRAPEDVPAGAVGELIDRAHGAGGEGLQVELGGYAVELYEEGEGGSETAALAGAAIVLLIAFGSVVAAGLPLVIALIGLGISSGGLIVLLANVVDVPDWTTAVWGVLGVGVGVDKGLGVLHPIPAG
jgi:putative drug exporter of the RND superfamily